MGFDYFDTERAIRVILSSKIQQGSVKVACHKQSNISDILHISMGQCDHKSGAMRRFHDRECRGATWRAGGQDTVGYGQILFTCHRNECCYIWTGFWLV